MNSTEYYRKNPDAAARKVAYQKKVNARPEEKKRRAELNRERRRRGIAGKGGPDVSHTKSGKTVLEDPHTNRGRQGSGGKPKLKEDVLTEWVSYDGAYAYGFHEDAGPNLSVGRGEKQSVEKGGGLTAKGRAKYNRQTGSNLKAPVTGKVKPGSKAAARRKSFCARSRSWKGERGKAARRRWKCDAAPTVKGKPCGQSFIPKTNNCTKSRTEAKKSTSGTATAAKVALTAGLLAGGAALLKNRKKPISLADWRKSPKNPRNKPKLSPEEANRISKEAVAKGKKLDMARPGCSLKKTDSRTDAFTPAKSKCASGAFGTYYVHPSKKYGVKTFTEVLGDEADPGFEFDMLGKAHYAGVNVPEPLAMNSVARGDGEDRVETLIMTHMDGYKTLAKAREHGNFPTIRVSDRYGDMVEMPRLIQLNFAREMKKLHMAGMSHGDLHTGNLMYKLDGKDAKKIGIIDMGYAMDMDTANHPIHGREPQENLLNDMRRIEDMLGIEKEIRPIKKRGLGNLIEETAIDYGRRWETYELAVSRYYDVVFRLINRNGSPRSKLLNSVEQPRIPGLNKEILRAAYSPSQLQFMNSLMNNGGVFATGKAREKFQRMGMKLTEAKAVLASLQKP